MSKSGSQNGQSEEPRVARILRSAGRRPRPPDELGREVKAAVREAWQEELRKPDHAPPSRLSSPRTRGWLALAASIVVVLAAAVYNLPGTPGRQVIATIDRAVRGVDYQTSERWRRVSEGMVIGSTRLQTKADAFASLSLVSGINVRLAANSRIDLLGTDQISLEQGSIYVDSFAAPADASIRINTVFGTAEDIGTRFLVNVDSAGWRVQVRDGLVGITDDGIGVQARRGDRIIISAGNELEKEMVQPHDASWSWVQNVSPVIAIDGIPLTEFLNWYARETGQTVKFRNERARRTAESTILHGSIDGLRPADSLSVVLSSTELTYIQENGAIRVGRQE